MPVEKMLEKMTLEKYWVPYALNIRVPKDQHEEFREPEKNESRKRRFQVFFEENLSRLPMRDNLDCFKERENPVKYVMDRLEPIFPKSYQVWEDKLSDEALTRFCLHGLGAHRVQVEKQDGKTFYVVRANALAGLPVREGFAHYGGDAYFDEHWQPVKIVDDGWNADTSHARNGQPVKPVVTEPRDQRWAEAKFRFRSSMAVLVTLVDHLYAIHLEAANILVTAMREQLSPAHPMRRFLTPFTYQTITVNDNACNNLVNVKSMSPRLFAFTEPGLAMAFNAAGSLVRGGFECSPPILDRVKYAEHLSNQGIATPFWQDAKDYWIVLKRYVWRYLAYYYAKPADLFVDKEFRAFLQQIEHHYKNVTSIAAMGTNIPKKSLVSSAPNDDNYEERYRGVVDLITFFIYLVTAGHEHVGSIEAYVQDPTFCAFKWIPGHMCATKQTAIEQALLMSFTSLPMPPLLGSKRKGSDCKGRDCDWTHLFVLDPEKNKRVSVSETWLPFDSKYERVMGPRESFEAFQQDLSDLEEQLSKEEKEVQKKKHPWNYPVYVFNPSRLEISVAV